MGKSFFISIEKTNYRKSDLDLVKNKVREEDVHPRITCIPDVIFS